MQSDTCRAPAQSRLWSRFSLHALVLLAALLIVADRVYWASVSQWREDQAMNLWLGFHFFRQSTPVGVISSTGLPNPNGMPLLGFLLSYLPNLLMVSAVLGCWQAYAAVLLCREAALSRRMQWIILLPLLTSLHMRGVGLEFWNNFLFLPIDMLFMVMVFRHLKRPRPVHGVIVLALILLSPGMYIAGLINAVTFAALWLLVCWLNGSRVAVSSLTRLATWGAMAGVVLFFAVFVWIPYASNVNLAQVAAASGRTLLGRLYHATLAVPLSLLFPLRVIAGGLAPSILADAEILTPLARALCGLANALLIVQLACCSWCIAVYIRERLRGSGERLPSTPLLLLLFIIVSHASSPLLGGYLWHRGDRLDQSIQCWPFALLLLFGLPFWLSGAGVPLSKARRWTRRLSIAFSVTSAVAGIFVVSSHLQYRGNHVASSDVPLWHKEKALAWIAQDWKSRSPTREIPVTFELLPAAFDWLPEFCKQLDPWYPGQMSVGRGLDYELLRRFGLRNAYEGRREAAGQEFHYIVSYARDPIPRSARHVEFGRLRVSLTE